jgi:hypothetical protein
VLGVLRRRSWPRHDDRVQGLRRQRHIGPVGPLDHDRDRDALALGQQIAFGAALAPVGGIGPRGAPRVGPWSSPRRPPARSTPILSGRRRPRARPPRAGRRPRPAPTRRSGGARSSAARTVRAVPPASGRRSAARRRSRPRSAGTNQKAPRCTNTPAPRL